LQLAQPDQTDVLEEKLKVGLKQAGCMFDPHRRRKWLLIVSNASGKGLAGQLLEQHWQPMMAHAGISAEVIVTEDRHHSLRIAEDLVVGEYEAVVCAGGDGLLYEVVNGVMGRPDWRSLLDGLHFGILPGGSGNGVSTSLCVLAGEACCPVSACFLLVKHPPAKADLASVTYTLPPASTCSSHDDSVPNSTALVASPSGDDKAAERGVLAQPFGRSYSLLGVMHGVVGDLDVESENLRCLGAERFTAQAVVRSIWHRQYASSVWYIPFEGKGAGEAGLALQKPASDENVVLEDAGSVLPDELHPPGEEDGGEAGVGEAHGGETRQGPILSFGSPYSALGSEWKQLDIPGGGDLFYFSAAKCPFISRDNRVSKQSTMSDGSWYLQVLPAANFCSAISFLLSLDTEGSHSDLAHMLQVRAKAFRLITGPSKQFCCCAVWCTCCPTTAAAKQGSRWVTVDGNVIPDTTLQGEVHDTFLSLLGYVVPGTC